MHLYRLLSRLLPGSFAAKAALIAALGTLAPVLALAALAFASGGPGVPVFTLAVAGGVALVVAVLTVMALRGLLHPLGMIARHLDAWEEGWHPGHLPESYQDELGRIMRQANRLMDQASIRLDRAGSGAEIDPLTGALNRAGAEAALAKGGPGWLIQFGLDGFDVLSERWGPHAAEEVLRSATRVARATLRPGDVLARLEDEVFAVVLPAIPAEGVRNVVERLQRAMEGQVRTRSGPVTISAGLVMHAGGTDAAEPLSRAGEALAHARRMGRSRVVESASQSRAA